jgi:hypothetical protein
MDQIQNNRLETNCHFQKIIKDKNISSFFDVYIIIKLLFLTSSHQSLAQLCPISGISSSQRNSLISQRVCVNRKD